MKLGIQLAIFHKRIAFQVYEQDTSDFHALGIAVQNGIIHRSREHEFALKVSATPEIRNESCFIRGYSTEAHWRVSTVGFSSNSARGEFLDRFTGTLNEFAEEYGVDFTHRDLGHTHLLILDTEP